MTTTETNSRPLGWVKTEINVELNETRNALTTFHETHNIALLQNSRPRLHRAYGALVMLNLEGAAVMCNTLDNLLRAFEKQQILEDEQVERALTLAGRALAELNTYLDDVTAGQLNQPLRFFPTYYELNAIFNKNPVRESDLFFPDLEILPPERKQMGQELTPTQLRRVRTRFQQALVNWIRQGDEENRVNMAKSVALVEAAQNTQRSRAFWWVAQAFIETLSEEAVAKDNFARRLCSRVDAQILSPLDWKNFSTTRLMSDMLYVIAQVKTPKKSIIKEVQDTYFLSALFPTGEQTATFDMAAENSLHELNKTVDSLENIWNKYCAGNRDLAPTFAQESKKLVENSEAVKQSDLKRLSKALSATAKWLQSSKQNFSDDVGMEVATAILLFHNALQNFRYLGVDFTKQVNLMVGRLQGCVSGKPPPEDANLPVLDDMTRQAQEKMLLAQLGQEIQSNMAQIEQILDNFFRDPSNRDDLTKLAPLFHQINGVFALLGQPEALGAINDCAQFCEKFEESGYAVNPQDFEHVADEFSMIGQYIDTISNGAESYDAYREYVQTQFLSPSVQIAAQTLELKPAIMDAESKAEAAKQATEAEAAKQAAAASAGGGGAGGDSAGAGTGGTATSGTIIAGPGSIVAGSEAFAGQAPAGAAATAAPGATPTIIAGGTPPASFAATTDGQAIPGAPMAGAMAAPAGGGVAPAGLASAAGGSIPEIPQGVAPIMMMAPAGFAAPTEGATAEPSIGTVSTASAGGVGTAPASATSATTSETTTETSSTSAPGASSGGASAATAKADKGTDDGKTTSEAIESTNIQTKDDIHTGGTSISTNGSGVTEEVTEEITETSEFEDFIFGDGDAAATATEEISNSETATSSTTPTSAAPTLAPAAPAAPAASATPAPAPAVTPASPAAPAAEMQASTTAFAPSAPTTSPLTEISAASFATTAPTAPAAVATLTPSAETFAPATSSESFAASPAMATPSPTAAPSASTAPAAPAEFSPTASSFASPAFAQQPAMPGVAPQMTTPAEFSPTASSFTSPAFAQQPAMPGVAPQMATPAEFSPTASSFASPAFAPSAYGADPVAMSPQPTASAGAYSSSTPTSAGQESNIPGAPEMPFSTESSAAVGDIPGAPLSETTISSTSSATTAGRAGKPTAYETIETEELVDPTDFDAISAGATSSQAFSSDSTEASDSNNIPGAPLSRTVCGKTGRAGKAGSAPVTYEETLETEELVDPTDFDPIGATATSQEIMADSAESGDSIPGAPLSKSSTRAAADKAGASSRTDGAPAAYEETIETEELLEPAEFNIPSAPSITQTTTTESIPGAPLSESAAGARASTVSEAGKPSTYEEITETEELLEPNDFEDFLFGSGLTARAGGATSAGSGNATGVGESSGKSGVSVSGGGIAGFGGESSGIGGIGGVAGGGIACFGGESSGEGGAAGVGGIGVAGIAGFGGETAGEARISGSAGIGGIGGAGISGFSTDGTFSESSEKGEISGVGGIGGAGGGIAGFGGEASGEGAVAGVGGIGGAGGAGIASFSGETAGEGGIAGSAGIGGIGGASGGIAGFGGEATGEGGIAGVGGGIGAGAGGRIAGFSTDGTFSESFISGKSPSADVGSSVGSSVGGVSAYGESANEMDIADAGVASSKAGKGKTTKGKTASKAAAEAGIPGTAFADVDEDLPLLDSVVEEPFATESLATTGGSADFEKNSALTVEDDDSFVEIVAPKRAVAPIKIDEELVGIFIDEARDVLENFKTEYRNLKKNPNNVEALTTIRRCTHTLKGSGRMVGLADLGDLAWTLEQTYNLWLKQNRPATPELLDLVRQEQETFETWIDALKAHRTPPDASALIALAEELRGENVLSQTQEEEKLTKKQRAKERSAKRKSAKEALATFDDLAAEAPNIEDLPESDATALPTHAEPEPVAATSAEPLEEIPNDLDFDFATQSMVIPPEEAQAFVAPDALLNMEEAKTAEKSGDGDMIAPFEFDANAAAAELLHKVASAEAAEKAEAESSDKASTLGVAGGQLAEVGETTGEGEIAGSAGAGGGIAGFSTDGTFSESSEKGGIDGGVDSAGIAGLSTDGTFSESSEKGRIGGVGGETSGEGEIAGSAGIAGIADADEIGTLSADGENSESVTLKKEEKPTKGKRGKKDRKTKKELAAEAKALKEAKKKKTTGAKIMEFADDGTIKEVSKNGESAGGIGGGAGGEIAGFSTDRTFSESSEKGEITGFDGEAADESGIAGVGGIGGAGAGITAFGGEAADEAGISDSANVGGIGSASGDGGAGDGIAGFGGEAADEAGISDSASVDGIGSASGGAAGGGIAGFGGEASGESGIAGVGGISGAGGIGGVAGSASEITSGVGGVAGSTSEIAGEIGGIGGVAGGKITDFDGESSSETGVAAIGGIGNSAISAGVATSEDGEISAGIAGGLATSATGIASGIGGIAESTDGEVSAGIAGGVVTSAGGVEGIGSVAGSVDGVADGIASSVVGDGQVLEGEVLPASQSVSQGVAQTASQSQPVEFEPISPELLEIFKEEVDEHLADIDAHLTAIENNPFLPSDFEITRAAHTVAGAAGTIGIMSIRHMGLALEHALLRRNATANPASTADIGVLREGFNGLQALFDELIERQAVPPAPQDLLDRLEATFPADELAPDAGLETQSESALATAATAETSATGSPLTTTPASPILAESAESQAAEIKADAPEKVAADLSAAQSAPKASLLPDIQDEIDEDLLPIFLEDSEETLEKISEEVRAWKANPKDEKHPATLARHLHTFKGNARMVGVMRLGEFTHMLESRVEECRKSGKVEPAFLNELAESVDILYAAVECLKKGKSLDSLVAPTHSADFEKNMPSTVENLASSAIPATTAPASPGVPAGAVSSFDHELAQQTLRVRADMVDRLVNEAGEIAIVRSRVEGEIRAIRSSVTDLTESLIRLRRQARNIEMEAERQIQAVHVSQQNESKKEFDPLELDRYTQFQELTRFLAESVSDVATIHQNLLKSIDDATAALVEQSRMNRSLQQDLMNVRMMPFSTQAERLHRLVRQTCRALNKQASLDITGGEIELDRSVLDKMMAPLEHMIRNSLSHGIESPRERRQLGKPDIGEIRIKLTQESNEIILSLSDDGKGMDPAQLRAKAIEKGFLDPKAEVDERHIFEFIFQPGFSTSKEVTQTSGRGVGMDVVKTEIGALGGRVETSSTMNKGTTFRLYLPLTLAVTQTLMVHAAGKMYAIPSSMIAQVLELKNDQITQATSQKFWVWKDESYEFHFLPRLLGDANAMPEPRRLHWVLLLRSGQRRIAVQVDDLQGTQEVVVKNIGAQVARVVGIAGATVLGDGRIVLILNPIALANRPSAPIIRLEEVIPELASVTTAYEPDHPKEEATKCIMVVDDSLTVRKITSRMLERNGYEVLLAKDGLEALEKLNSAERLPDVVLSDIEMPKMDGFDLLKNIRDTERLKHLPVIMITSRTADKHRNFALKTGANEYLGKPYNEEHLLELLKTYTSKP